MLILARSLAFEALFYALMGVMGILGLPAVLLSRDATLRVMKLYCRIVLGILGLLCGLRWQVQGAVPTGTVLVAAKHQSFLDVLILMLVLPRPKFVMKRSLLWMPVFGLYAWRIGCVAIDREAGMRAMNRMRAGFAAQGSEGGQVVIYPQGTRVAPGARLPYRPGAGLLYAAFALPCVPVATDSGRFWSRASLLRRPGLATVAFLDPLAAGLAPRAFLGEIEARIEAASDALLPHSGE
jgi:1-acyl-sn-glycerol-3-phosphate acyltransferase